MVLQGSARPPSEGGGYILAAVFSALGRPLAAKIMARAEFGAADGKKEVCDLTLDGFGAHLTL